MLAASFSSFDTMNIPSSLQQQQPDTAAQVAEKVMRRIEIAKVARNLQDCLAFASFKAQNGWQDRTLSTIEPEITEKLARRKRPYPEDTLHSDGSSTISDEHSSTSSRRFTQNPGQSYPDARKRVRAASNSHLEKSSHTLTWQQDQRYAQSSPVVDRPSTMDSNMYASLQDSPMFDVGAADDHDQRMQSIHEPASSIVSSSPPRTPPPTRRNHHSTKHAGAEALLFLANSPRTPAVHVHNIPSASKDMPSTPPSQHAHLPSSMMQTPGHLGLFNGALQTPGNFNLADFCNVTPSPAQAHFSRTPVPGRTPGRLARRSLNFDALAPPTPTTQRKASEGLALQLGEELGPRS